MGRIALLWGRGGVELLNCSIVELFGKGLCKDRTWPVHKNTQGNPVATGLGLSYGLGYHF